MPVLSEDDQKRVESAVAEAEKKTAAEFVTVIARSSGHFRYLPTLAAAAAMMLLSAVALVVPWPFSLTVGEFYLGQAVLFIALFFLFRWRPIRHRLVPRPAQHARASLRAHQLFLDLGLASTRDRTGILLFASLAERYVEIITDRGVRDVVDDAAWADALTLFRRGIANGDLTGGFVGAIEHCAAALAEKLPPRPDDRNELPDRLVEV